MKKNVKRQFIKLSTLAISLGSMLVALSCNDCIKHQCVLGSWQVDSTLTYYNGFSHLNKTGGGNWGLCSFGEDSIMRESKYGTYRSFHYGFKGNDSLCLSPTNANDTINFQILEVNKEHMVLKMPQPPIFQSKAPQERYEIRYYSKTDPPTEKLTVLYGYKE